MYRFLLLYYAILFSFCALAQVNAQESKQNHYYVEVSHNFLSYNNCSGGFPYLHSMKLEANSIVPKYENGYSKIRKISDSSYKASWIGTCYGTSLRNAVLSFEGEIKGLGNKGKIYKSSGEISINSVKDINTLLERGGSVLYNKISDYHHCSLLHTEGYTLTTSLTIDNPISVEILNEDKNLRIDKSDKGMLHLKFGEFYNESYCKRRIEYKVDGDTKWREISNKDIYIASGGEAFLTYEDIVGEYSDSNDDYNRGFAKFMSFRVVKTLLSGDESYANVVSEVRFYDLGPDFEIAEIRSPYCRENGLSIRVNINKDDYEKYRSFDDFSWEIKSPAGNQFTLRALLSERDHEGLFKLEGDSKDNNVSLSSYLADMRNDISGEWSMQLKYNGVEDNYFQSLAFSTRTFTIPEGPKTPIEITQSAPIFTIGGVDYHLASSQDPYLSVLITDNEEDRTGRLPYEIEIDGKLILISEGAQISDESQLVITKEQYLKDNEIVINTFRNDKIKQWYYMHQTDGLAKLCKIASSGDNCMDMKSNLGLLVQKNGSSNYIFNRSSNDLFIVSGDWRCSSSYLSSVFIYAKEDQYTPDLICLIEIDKQRVMEYHPRDNGTTKTLYTINNSTPRYNFICGNTLTLLVSDGSDYYFIYPINSKQNIIKVTTPEFYKKKCIMDTHDNIIVLGSDSKTVTIYSYADNTWRKTQYTLALEAESVEYIEKDESGISFKAKDGNFYKQYFDLSETDFGYIFNEGNAYIPITHFDSEIDRYKEQLWQQYVIENCGYKIPLTENQLNKDKTLILYDRDGCSYSLGFRVNVLKDYDVSTVSVHVEDNGDKWAEISFTPGGSGNLVYNNSVIEKKQTFSIPGLSWGRNDITYYYGGVRLNHSIVINPNVSLGTMTPQKCTDGFGYIELVGSDLSKITAVECKNIVNGVTATFDKVYNLELKAGIYDIKVRFDDFWIDLGTTEITDEIFGVKTPITKKDANEIGGLGSASISFDHASLADVIWFDETGQTITPNWSNLAPGEYNLTANHNGCELPVKFDITAPTFIVTKFNVTQIVEGATNGKMTFEIDGKKSLEITSYYFTINGKKYEQSVCDTLVYTQIPESFDVELHYKVKSSDKYLDLKLAKIKTIGFNPTISENENNVLRCFGTDGKIDIDTHGNGICQYKIGTGKYIDFDDRASLSVSDSVAIVTVKRTLDQNELPNCQYGNVTMEISKSDSISIVQIEPLTFKKEISEVSCRDMDTDPDGGIVISNILNVKGGKGASVVKVDDSVIEYEKESDTYKCTSLLAGEHKLYIKDSGCETNFHEETFVIKQPEKPLTLSISSIEPSCRNNDGEIIVSANGGGDQYAFFWGERTENNSLSYIQSVGDINIGDSDVTKRGGKQSLNNKEILETLFYSENQKDSFKDIPSGDYYFAVCDNKGCVVTESYTLKEYTNPSIIDVLTDQTSCYGLSDGKIKDIKVKTNGELNGNVVTPSKLYYRFNPKNEEPSDEIKEQGLPWADGIDNLAAGEYYLWVEDNNGCVTDDVNVRSVSVAQPNLVTLDVTKYSDISEYGASDAVIRIRAEGGNNCNKKIYVKRTEDEKHDEEQSEDVIYNGIEEIAQEYYIGEAATRNIEYQITKHAFSKGEYSFQVRDIEKECPSNVVRGVVVESPEEPLSAMIEAHKALCHNQTGYIEITPQGGWGAPYKVFVDEVEYRATQSTPTITVDKLVSGQYVVTIKDKIGIAEYHHVAYVPMPNDEISFGEGTTFVADRCNGNGAAHIEIVGGSGEYKEILLEEKEFAADKIDMGGLRAGLYTMKVKDTNECEATLEFEIADERLSTEIISYNTIEGGATLESVVSGGGEPYSYKWSNVDGLQEQIANSNIIEKLDHGIYTLLVTDANGCQVGPVLKNVITDGDQMLRIIELQRETSVGSANGYVVIGSDIVDFRNKILYHIDIDGILTEKAVESEFVDGLLRIDGLSGGDYVVKCLHSDGKHFSMTRFRIEPYERLDIVDIEVRHATQPQRSDGRVRISLEGGIAPFVTTVTHNSSSAFEPISVEANSRCFDIEELIAGEYTMKVMDSTNNEANAAVKTFIVHEPENLSLSAKMIPALCHGDPSGIVNLTATGGWGKYMFEYASNGYEKMTEYRSLLAGMQIFSVIDEYGTQKTIEVMVEQPDEVRTQVAHVDSVDCFGNFTGNVTFHVTGGDSHYTMWYSDKNKEDLLYSQSDTTLSGLSMGHYRITFTDSNDCKSVDTIAVFIPEPDLLELNKDDIVNTTCELDNGKLAIEMKGGSLPYTYAWRENGVKYDGAKTIAMTKSEASSLKQNGLYSIEIVDKNGCKASYEKRIEHSENPKVLTIATTDVLCYGFSDGVAAVDSSQVKWGYPKAAYHVTWPQGEYDVMRVNTLPAGIYTVRVTDDNNCSTSKEFEVGRPQPVKNHLTELRDALCFGYNDGRIETITTGGVGDYRYMWSTGEETSFADNLKAGTYTVVVKDGHECADTMSYSVAEPEKLIVDLGDDVIICPGSSYTFDAGDFASYQWYRDSSDDVIETQRQLTTTEGGEIHILVKNDIGCMARDTVFVGISDEALVANFLVASNVSLNDTVVAIELSNMQPERIVWEYQNAAFSDVSPSDSTKTYRYLRTEKLGVQYITMWAYKGDCVSSETKQVEVFENVEIKDDIQIGYDPLIQSVKAAPNPNNGEFFLIISLREESDVMLRMTDVTGSKVMDSVLSGAEYYKEKINIGKTGVYILSLSVGDEQRYIKILSVK